MTKVLFLLRAILFYLKKFCLTLIVDRLKLLIKKLRGMGLVTNRVYLRNVSMVISIIIKQNKSKDKNKYINTKEETQNWK